MSLGKHMRHLRENHGVTLETVANRAGVSISYLSDIERGRRSCPVRTADKLARAMHERPESFVQLVLEEELAGLDLEVVVRKKLKGVP